SALPVSPGILYQTAMISLLPEDTKLLAQNNVYRTFSRYSITGIRGFFFFKNISDSVSRDSSTKSLFWY
ncbi:MAG: hypothetical protein PUF59_05840, partial [Lachnospiraceae bacterium]|nr:hypothetical protein [Lachnospiraceae bacterium]